MYYFSLNGSKLVDGSLKTDIVLCDVNLDDTRPHRENKITRFMERREQGTHQMISMDLDSLAAPARSMIDINFEMKDNDMFGKIYTKILLKNFQIKMSFKNYEIFF